MKKLLYAILFMLPLISCGRYEYHTFEVTYIDGTTQFFTEEHLTYSDGSFHKKELNNGCISHTGIGKMTCGIRSIKY